MSEDARKAFLPDRKVCPSTPSFHPSILHKHVCTPRRKKAATVLLDALRLGRCNYRSPLNELEKGALM